MLFSKAIEAAIQPWVAVPAKGPIGEEAHVILEIQRFAEVVSNGSEVILTFSGSEKEAYLAEALVAGGLSGSVDLPRMLRALRAATGAGSAWAPLWLGDVERLQMQERAEDRATVERCCRRWYLEAVARGHPDALHRLNMLQAGGLAQSSPPMNADNLCDISAGFASEELCPMEGAIQEPPAHLASAFAGSGALGHQELGVFPRARPHSRL
ncbi:unnamed protein product [Effrenium voratum]|nr:unnamed protein product [Effrenium voratum]